MRSIAFLCVASLAAACGSKQAADQAAPLGVAPESVEMPPGVQQKFSAGAGPVAWSVAEGAPGGSIAADGTYTSPSQPGTYHVVAQRAGLSGTATVRVSIAPGVSVAVDPPAADVGPGSTMQLKATVTGAPDRSVFWFVREGESGGRIDAAGRYAAPLSTGLFHIVAVSQADPSKNASAAVSVSVKPTVTVSIDPPSAALKPSAGARFSAAVTGTTETAVRWFVVEGAAGGTVDGNGHYQAPDAEGVFHLVAASEADPGVSATVEIKVARSVTLTLTPAVATVRQGATQNFTATVSGSDPRVQWSIAEGDAGGSVNGRGLYQAPFSAGVYHLVATSVADGSRSAVAVITVPAETLSVAVTPALSTLRSDQTVQLTASVSGSAEKRVYWSADKGSVTQDGLYTAPHGEGSYRVTAQSFADPTKSGSAFVTVVAEVEVRIDPAQVVVHAGDSVQLTARVSGTSDRTVTWSVQEAGGGRVGGSGLYTAPRSEGIFHVVATSHADPGKKAVAAVTVSWFDLLDKGGAVIPDSRTFALWWGDPAAWPADVRPTQEALLSGLNGSAYLAIADQYMRGARTSTSFAGSMVDASAAPTSADPATVGGKACAALTAAGVTPKASDLVVVYGAAAMSAQSYCAWHWYASCGGATILIAWIPNPKGTSCLAPTRGCNQLSDVANSMANAIVHEMMEAITDPYATSWMDSDSQEIADKCEGDFRCVRIGAGTFQLQSEYSNAAHACVVP